MSEVKYDTSGRMLYHHEFHTNHGKVMEEEELEYLCKFHDVDGLESIALALGRTQMTLATKLTKLKKNGRYEYYRKLNHYI